METKLRNVFKKYAVMRASRTGSGKLQFENLFDVSACKCNHVEIVKSGKLCCKCPRQSQILVQGKMCFNGLKCYGKSFKLGLGGF